MNTLFARLMYKLLVLFTSFSVLTCGGITPCTDDPIKSLDSDSVRLTAVYWGDTQVSDYMPERQKNVLAACEDLNNASQRTDALIIAGDIAENGKAAEYMLVLDDLKTVDTVDHFIPATGNHDIRLRLFGQTVKNFSEFVNTLEPELELDKLYYSYDVNGYRFIVLGSTRTVFEEACIDETELMWLDSQLASVEEGKPTFVIVHQPLKLTHNLPDAWNSSFDFAGSIGDQSDNVAEILNKYDNVFLLTGHLHSGLGENNFEQIGNFVSVNVPSLGIVSKDGGYEAAGTGYMIEVYDNSVLFRARNFAGGMYLPEFDREFALK